MDDLISRETMKDAIESTTWYHQNRNKDMVKGASDEETAWYKAEDVYKAIENVPTAQPDIARDIATILKNEQDMMVILQNAQPTQNNNSNALKAFDCIDRQTGTWIYTPTEPLGYTCSVCGKGCCRFNFCPHCGAKMEVEK